jgi:hypothetical protein
MNVLIAKDLKKKIEDYSLKSVRELNSLLKSMTNETFDFSSSRSIQVNQTEILEVRAGDLDVFFHIKDQNIFILQVHKYTHKVNSHLSK